MESPGNTLPFALTMGDPAGIGPQIAIKALRQSQLHNRVFIIGDLAVLEDAAIYSGISADFLKMSSVKEFDPEKINCFDMKMISPGEYSIGKAQPQCGKAAFAYIEKAISLAVEKKIAGVITNPINKESLKMAGINFPGHTEIFASKTGVSDYSMLFLLKGVTVAHVTTHCSLRTAIDLISKERVYSNIKLLNRAIKGLGINNPRIAVGGLNPHAGENGLFGDEEIVHLKPAIEKAVSEGMNVSGPYPPDTVFMRAFKGEFDGIVSMLHDHGFVALKSMDFEHGVNITTGLPIIRTSVGHGTAFDIVKKGTASEESLVSAIHAAFKLFENHTEY
jgi:4-hydroxythreonine-4-phosphate dehydrogenase